MLLVAIASTIAATPFARKLAVACDAIDYPDKRRVNTEPIPRMGGVAMMVGIIASVIVIDVGVLFFGWVNPFSSSASGRVDFALVGLGVAFMFIVGIIDDISGLRARYKFIGQLIAAAIVSSSGLLLQNIQNPFVEGGFIEFGWLAYPITVIYLVCFANIINLIDGLDGLASGISAISAGTIFVFAIFAGRTESAILCVIIVGICVGFLKYNHHPASIFMGDSGSLLLGLSLGIVSLLAVARSTLIISLLVPILAAGVPIMDTAAAIIRRTRAHQPIDAPDKGHIHHRLLAAGYTQESTVFIMWAWTAMLAVCGIVLAESEGMVRVAVIVVAAVVTGVAIYKLRLLNPVLQHYYNPRKSKQQRQEEEDAEVMRGIERANGRSYSGPGHDAEKRPARETRERTRQQYRDEGPAPRANHQGHNTSPAPRANQQRRSEGPARQSSQQRNRRQR